MEAKALLVHGLASVDIVNGVPDEYVAASTKVLGADQVTEFESQVRSMYDQMARISIEPLWARFFDFRCWPHAVLPHEAGRRRLAGNRLATSPNLISSFILCEPLQSGALATQ
jgi:hypothetical protein